MRFNKEDNAAYIAFRAAKYKREVKYLSPLSQQEKSQ